MSSSDRPIFRVGDESTMDQTQPDLLPQEFQWQGGNGSTTSYEDPTVTNQGSTYSPDTTYGTGIPTEGTVTTPSYGTGYDSNYTNGWPATTTDQGGMVTQPTGVYGADVGTTYQQGTPMPDTGVVTQPTGTYGSDVGTTYQPGDGQMYPYPQDGSGQQVPPWTPQNTGDGTVPPVMQPGQTGVQPGMDQTQPAAQPAASSDAQTSTSSDKGGGGPLSFSWLADRGLSLGATGIAASRSIDNLAQFLPEGKTIPTLESLKSIPKEEWLKAGRTDLGKAMGGAWIGDTLLDATILGGKDTSWKTMAVDIATPFLVSRMVPGIGVGKTILASLGAHTVEKLLFEGDKDK